MRSRIILIGCLLIPFQPVFSLVLDRNSEAYQISSLSWNNAADDTEGKDIFNKSIDLAYISEKIDPEGETERIANMEEQGNKSEDGNENLHHYSNVRDSFLMIQHEKCLRSKGLFDCLKFKIFRILKDLFELTTSDSSNFSDVVQSRAINTRNEALLVTLPFANETFSTVMANTFRRILGNQSETFEFLVHLLDNFLSRHGFLMTVQNMQYNQTMYPNTSWFIDLEHTSVARSNRKVKKKEIAIIFPMLVLFKFLKIKMLLVPILLGIVFLKKLLILTLTLLPYLIGLFGCCRRPPFFNGLQSAGYLQEVDTRGEFSSNVGYSFPYRDDFPFKSKDKTRPSDSYGEY